MQGQIEDIKNKKNSMFAAGTFEREQSFACLEQPAVLHAHSHFSEPGQEERRLFL